MIIKMPSIVILKKMVLVSVVTAAFFLAPVADFGITYGQKIGANSVINADLRVDQKDHSVPSGYNEGLDFESSAEGSSSINEGVDNNDGAKNGVENKFETVIENDNEAKMGDHNYELDTRTDIKFQIQVKLEEMIKEIKDLLKKTEDYIRANFNTIDINSDTEMKIGEEQSL